MTMTLVETITVGSGGVSSIDFTNIPQEAGADLMILYSGRASNLIEKLTFNSDTANNYKYKMLKGSDTAASNNGEDAASSITFRSSTELGQTANTFGNASILISNYTSTTTKSVSIDAVSEHNGEVGTSYRNIVAGSYTTTSPITSISWNSNGGTTFEHTTASLYIIS